jgi:exopolysaccharide production protein ExoQ
VAHLPDSPRQPRLSRWWLPLCVITLVIASDYQLRNRPPEAALAASVDTTIVFELAMYAVVAAYLVAVHGAPLRLRTMYPTIYLAGLLIGLMGLSLAYTPSPQYAVVRIGQMVVLFSLTAIAASKGTRDDFHRLAHAFMVLVALSVAYGIAVPSIPVNERQAGRFTWFAIHPTVSGILAGLAALIALAYVTASRRTRPGPMWSQGVYIGLLVVNGGAMIAAQTRGAIGGVVAGAVVLLVASRREARSRIELILAGLVTLAGLILLAGEQITAYFVRGESAEQLTTLNSRTDLWATALDVFGRNPMFGHGVTSSRGLFYDETGLGGGHNAFINILVELGVVGTAVWLMLIGLVLASIWTLDRGGPDQLIVDRALLLGVVVFLLVDGMFYEGIGGVTNIAITWFFMCLAWTRVAQRAGLRNDPPAAVSNHQLRV